MPANIQFLFPEIILTLIALTVLMASVWKPAKGFLGALTLAGILAAGVVFVSQGSLSPFTLMLTNDLITVFFRGMILFIAALVILLSMGYAQLVKEEAGELYFFILVVAISMMIAVSSRNLMMIYVAIEAVSLISYMMAGYFKRDLFSSEGGLKYFLFGAFSTGTMLYGISLVYGLFGTLDMAAIVSQAATVNQPAFILALILTLAGVGFKCSLVPFHMWTPDVYQGAPTPVTAFLSVGPKAMGFAVVIRIFLSNFSPLVPSWPFVAAVLAVLTMTIGNLMAVGQTNIKRLLAFSSIAQAGYILIGLAAGTVLGIKAVLFYIFVYTSMNLGAFGAVIMAFNDLKSDRIEDYAGLYKRDPLTAVILTISLLSLAGIPPLAGFLAKFYLLWAAVEAKFIALAVIAALNSVIALYYYVKVVRYMFLHESKEKAVGVKSLSLQIVLLVTVAGTLVIGIWPHPIFAWLAHL